MPYLVTSSTYVELNAVPLTTPGWRTVNPMVLRSGFATRGSSTLIPGAAGVLPGRRRLAPVVRSLLVIVNGDVDWNGNAYSNTNGGVSNNVEQLVANIRAATGVAVPCTLHYRAGNGDAMSKSADVHVEAFEEGDDLGIGSVRCTISLFIPAGRLT